MSDVAAGIALPLAVLGAAWLILGAVVSVAHRVLRPALAAATPADRAALLLGLALLPPSVAALAAIFGFSPVIGGLIVDTHCHEGIGCVAHVPALHTRALYAGVLAAGVAAAAGAWVWPLAGRLRRSLQLAGALSSLSEHVERRRYEVIRNSEPFAYCVGLVRPRIVVSDGLLARLSASELESVLQHEEAHAARRDNLRRWLAAAALAPLPRRMRGPLLHDLAVASEQACDLEAARATSVATVLDALRALSSPEQAQGVARARITFGADQTLAPRMAALHAPQRRGAPLAVPVLITLAYCSSVLGVTVASHHGVELVLSGLAQLA